MKILVTGGAGFIGSNLVESLLRDSSISLVRVLDNLATGNISNISEFENNPKFEFIEGDIRNIEDCKKACEGMNAISHQAALGSVPRSILDPKSSFDVNLGGFINMLEAAKSCEIKRFVYASSSSVYGDLKESPKKEGKVGKILSPYAATKMADELFAEAFSRNYNMTIIGLRYFNVFGPKQSPNGPYAAVIPCFIKAAIDNKPPTINGDGTITRDFTPINNVVQVNTKALIQELSESTHYVFNVACGQTTSLNQIWEIVKNLVGSKIDSIHGPERKGDILFSLADISYVKEILNYNPEFDLKNSLKITIDYMINNSK